MPHTIDIKVRGYHLDVYGHVNNARHLEFLEEARWSIIETRIDINTLIERGLLFVVVNININYRRPAFLSEILSIETNLIDTKTHSAVLRQTARIKGTDKIVTDAEITFVILDSRTQKPVKLDGEIGDLLKALSD
ncbi:MAG: thioesterase family protein [Desulfosarcinaceae bacterium]|jgi:thioesterase III